MCCNCCTDKWTCCCCCHVTKGAHVLAWICVFIGILCLPILLLYLSVSLLLFIGGILAILPYFSGVPIILGELRGKRTHRMYLPFLIVFGIGLVYTIFYAGADIYVKMNEGDNTINSTKSSDQMNRTINKSEHIELSKTTQHTIEIAVYLIVWILILALNIWLFSIVLRAYIFVKSHIANLNGGGNRKIENIAL